MDDIQEDAETKAVRGVDEEFQILRCAEARARGEERGNMVAERAIIRMFLYGHELHDVVSGCGDARQNGLGKLTIGVDARFLSSHADVRFINPWRGDLRGIEFMFPNVGLRRVPNLAAIVMRRRVLDGAADEGGDAVAPRAIRANDVQFDFLSVG